jgi:hypothetical protein
MVRNIAQSFDYRVIELLPDRGGDEVKITEEVVEAAAGNSRSGKEVMMLLLDRRGDDVKITNKVVEVVVGNYRSGKEVMILLLDRRGDEVKITDKVVEAVVSNSRSGKEVIMLLLDRRGDDVKITDKVIEAAVANEDSGELISLLLDRRGDKVKITNKVVEAVAYSGQEGGLCVLKQRFAVNIGIWEPIAQLYHSSKTGDEKVVQKLLGLGVDPNAKDYHGRTPLWWSASNGHASVTILLLKQDNVQLNETDINGCTNAAEKSICIRAI